MKYTERKTVTVNMPVKLLEELRNLAGELGLTVSSLVTTQMNSYVNGRKMIDVMTREKVDKLLLLATKMVEQQNTQDGEKNSFSEVLEEIEDDISPVVKCVICHEEIINREPYQNTCNKCAKKLTKNASKKTLKNSGKV